MGTDCTGGESDGEDVLRELGEIGVGAIILGLRQVNISRRRLVAEVPAIEPAVDAVLDQVEQLAAPTSAAAGALVAAIGDSLPGPRGQQLTEAGALVATLGPELLRLSGLTKRD